MHFTSVESSNLSGVAWENETLFVRFKNNKVYAYDGVPHSEYTALVTAPSVGKYLNSTIKGSYPFREVDINLSATCQPGG